MNNAVELFRQPPGRGQLLVPPEPHRDATPEDRLDLNTLLTTLRRRRGLFLTVLVATMAISIVLTLLQQPLYTATTRVVLNTHQEQIAPTTAPGTPIVPADRADTEVEVLESRELAGRVADALRLDQDPVFNPELLPPTRLDVLKARIFGSEPPEKLPPAILHRIIVDELVGSLQATRLGETYAMEIAITTASPDDAARIANEYGRQYTQGQLQEKLDENRTASHFLSGRLDELRAQAQLDTQKVQQYRIAHNLLSTSGASLTEQEISTYNQQVSAARAQAAEDEARLNTARTQLRLGSNGDDVGEALGSSVVSGLRSQQAQVSAALAVLTARYGPLHPDVLKAKSELAAVDTAIQSEIRRVISNLEAKASVSRERLESISGSLSGARGALQQNNAAMAGLDDLQRRAQASQGLYESYLNRYKETVAQGGTERPDANIISEAERPSLPSSPRVGLNLMLGLVIGSGLGLAAAFLAELLFSGMTTGEDVEHRLNLPYLSGIPLMSSILKASSPIDTIVTSPRSGYAEAFRSLRTSLHYFGHPPPQVIAVTSALSKEGKTTIAICLARTMAIDGEKTLVIDCDVTKSSLSARLIEDEPAGGLVEVLKGEALLDDVIVTDAMSGMDILPLTRRHGNLADLLSGSALVSLLGELRRRYAYIVIDTAPVLPIAETRSLAAMADAVVFVVRWRHTPDHAIKAALRMLPSRCAERCGGVLTRIHMRKQGRFGRGDPAFYYKKYRGYYAA